MNLEEKISELAFKYTPLAREILAECVRIPEDFIEINPFCGMSNNEGPRLEYLKKKIIEIGSVRKPEDVFFDDFGNITWIIEGKNPKYNIWFDGHTDTVAALRNDWLEKVGIDCYKGINEENIEEINEEKLRENVGFLPPKEEWNNLLFGRGTCDQLSGVVSQVIATKIMLETEELGSIDGIRIRAIGTVSEEDNDGGGPMDLLKRIKQEEVPDVVILTEPTGDTTEGALGIYRGQRGRMTIEVEVIGRSCHGSMPWKGLNPVEYGSKIIVEAMEKHEKGEGFLEHEFLGKGSRTCSWGFIDTPSDCAVPERFVFRFDRRITVGETPEFAVKSIEELESVLKTREKGLIVNIKVPRYQQLTWKKTQADNPQIYMSWITPEEDPSINAAIESYKSIISPFAGPGRVSKEPRVSRWIFSTDGVGYPVPDTWDKFEIPDSWLGKGSGYRWPAMFGFGAGYENHAHSIGEYVDVRQIRHAIGLLSIFPKNYNNFSMI